SHGLSQYHQHLCVLCDCTSAPLTFFIPHHWEKCRSNTHDRETRGKSLSISVQPCEWRSQDHLSTDSLRSGAAGTRETQGGDPTIPTARARDCATPASRQSSAECSGYDAACSTAADRAVYTTFRNSHTSRGGTMPHHHELETLGSLVETAETQRTL